jgi:hypothetical protein
MTPIVRIVNLELSKFLSEVGSNVHAAPFSKTIYDAQHPVTKQSTK